MRLVLDTNVVASALLWGGLKIEASMFSLDQLVDRYRELTIVVRPVTVSGIAPDRDDDVVIGTALAAKADWIVTGDRSFLSVAAYQGVRIVGVSEAVKSIGTR